MTRIVELKDTKPLIIDPKKLDDTVWLCRCGLSQDWPYCDSSHKQTRSEEDGVTYAYTRPTAGAPLQRTVVSDPPEADPRP